MRKCPQTAILEPRYRIFIFNRPISTINKVFLIFLKKSETSHNDQVDYSQSAKLLYLIDEPRERKSDKYEERIARVGHYYRQFQCIK